MTLRFLSVCSGIEAASVAFTQLGWGAVGFSEIERFPCEVLAHHYGSNMPGKELPANGIPNFGDFTTIPIGEDSPLGCVDILVGGTPCQAFSVAGKRLSLKDARGNLTLAFTVLAHELVRFHGCKAAFWENVPGVLNTPDNAFGCFLAALVGADDPLCAPGGERWPDAGMVAGPRARLAWRVLDAQYFGLAQRRKRVFVVADFGGGADPAAVLFERAGLRRVPPTRRKAREGIAGTLSSRTQVRSYRTSGNCGAWDTGDRVDALTTASDPNSHVIAEPYTLAVRGRGDTHNLEYRQDGTANAILTPNGGRAGMGVGAVAYSIMPQNSGKDYTARPVDVAQPLMAGGPVGGNQGGDVIAQPYTIHGTDKTVAVASETDIAGLLRTKPPGSIENSSTTVVAFSAKDDGRDATVDLSPTLRAGTHSDSHANAGVMPAIASAWAVRRLTPKECARLQGFPDDYLDIVVRGKPAADGPKYKALGNSWAVPCVRWIGERIAANWPKKSAPPVQAVMEAKP